MGAISLLSSFKTIGGIESGPEALWGFKHSIQNTASSRGSARGRNNCLVETLMAEGGQT